MAMHSLCRALARIASPHPTTIKPRSFFIIYLLEQQQQQSSSYSTSSTSSITSAWSPFKRKQNSKTTTNTRPSQQKKLPSTDWPRPKEIPFQGKVANSVNLIGYVDSPIHFQVSSPDGKYLAATVINQDASFHSPTVRIPIIFEGDLAHIAASHLKKGDNIYVAGQLTANPPPFTVMNGEAQVQVMVHSINFIEGASVAMKSHSRVHEEVPLKDSEDDKIEQSWMQLLVNPDEWWDIRSDMDNSKGAAFERKDNGELLWIDDSTSKWIKQKIEVMTFDQKTKLQGRSSSIKKDGDSPWRSWKDLLDNPTQWWDYRKNKLSGSVSQKHPDFKHKDGHPSLWLDKAPVWVISKLEGLEFETDKQKQLKQPTLTKAKGEESWKNLVENPAKWWDNRLDKKNVKAPDFKHKETGEALWLNSSPPWVLTKLPPLRNTQKVADG